MFVEDNRQSKGDLRAPSAWVPPVHEDLSISKRKEEQTGSAIWTWDKQLLLLGVGHPESRA